MLPALRRTHGELKLYLREDLTKRLLERLRAGRLDVALIPLPFDTGDLYVRELFKDEFSFVAREADPAVRSVASGVSGTPVVLRNRRPEEAAAKLLICWYAR